MVSEETRAATLRVNVAALQQEGTLMTQRKFTVLTIVGLLAVAVTDAARSGALVFGFDASNFTSPTTLTNDYWGLRLGGPVSAVYFSAADDGCEMSESVVSGTTGSGFFTAPFNIDALVVRDREWLDEDCTGEYILVEDTFDWYAQDDDGNVWYLGEDTTAWDDEANCLTDAGSWKAGDDGAVPGVLMLSHPRPGLSYQQEYYEGEAEDWAKILRLGARVSIDLGDYLGCLMTKEYTPLSPGEIEHKFYCRLSQGGSGLMLVNELKGKTRRVEYIGTTLPEGEFPGEFPVPSDELCRE
jgi:hypothetical protein